MRKRYQTWAAVYGHGSWRGIIKHPDRKNIIVNDLLWVLTGRL